MEAISRSNRSVDQHAVIGWRAWFLMRNVVTKITSRELTWANLPKHGFLGVMLFYAGRGFNGHHLRGWHTGEWVWREGGEFKHTWDTQPPPQEAQADGTFAYDPIQGVSVDDVRWDALVTEAWASRWTD